MTKADLVSLNISAHGLEGGEVWHLGVCTGKGIACPGYRGIPSVGHCTLRGE